MNTRTLGGLGTTAAAMVALVGLAGQARSDNSIKPASPVQAAPKALSPASDPEWESTAKSFEGFKADTKPSRDTTMQFPAATEIKELKVVGGQRVKKGDVLIRARDSDIIASIAQQRDLAENTLEIAGAEKQAALAQFKFDRLKGGGAYSPTEYREAEINAEVTRVQVDQAKKNKIQQELRLKQAEASFERYYLEAPFDGIVEEVMVELGEGVTEQSKVLHLVNIEKLWLDPYASTPETIKLKLKEGSPAWVLVDMPDAPRLVQGHVLYVSPVADSVSQTRRVRVEIDNPEGWPAGTQARVRFTEPGKEWEKYQAKGTRDGVSVAPGTGFRHVTNLDLSNVLSEMVAKPVDARVNGPAAQSTQNLARVSPYLSEFTFDIVIDGAGRDPCGMQNVTWNLHPVSEVGRLETRPPRRIQPPPDPRRAEQFSRGTYIPGPPGTKIGEPSK